MHDCPRPLRCVDNVTCRLIEHTVIVSFHADADSFLLLAGHSPTHPSNLGNFSKNGLPASDAAETRKVRQSIAPNSNCQQMTVPFAVFPQPASDRVTLLGNPPPGFQPKPAVSRSDSPPLPQFTRNRGERFPSASPLGRPQFLQNRPPSLPITRRPDGSQTELSCRNTIGTSSARDPRSGPSRRPAFDRPSPAWPGRHPALSAA